MTDTTIDRLRQLSDSEIVAVAREFFDRVFAAVPFDQVQANFDADPAVAGLATLDAAALRRELPADESKRLSCAVLEAAARDPALEPLVRESIELVQRSDQLVVEVILSLGLLVNLTLLLATTRLRVHKGGDGRIIWDVSKDTATPELMKTVVEPVVKAIASIGAGFSASATHTNPTAVSPHDDSV
jgi:hypothetical protein